MNDTESESSRARKRNKALCEELGGKVKCHRVLRRGRTGGCNICTFTLSSTHGGAVMDGRTTRLPASRSESDVVEARLQIAI